MAMGMYVDPWATQAALDKANMNYADMLYGCVPTVPQGTDGQYASNDGNVASSSAFPAAWPQNSTWIPNPWALVQQPELDISKEAQIDEDEVETDAEGAETEAEEAQIGDNGERGLGRLRPGERWGDLSSEEDELDASDSSDPILEAKAPADAGHLGTTQDALSLAQVFAENHVWYEQYNQAAAAMATHQAAAAMAVAMAQIATHHCAEQAPEPDAESEVAPALEAPIEILDPKARWADMASDSEDDNSGPAHLNNEANLDAWQPQMEQVKLLSGDTWPASGWWKPGDWQGWQQENSDRQPGMKLDTNSAHKNDDVHSAVHATVPPRRDKKTHAVGRANARRANAAAALTHGQGGKKWQCQFIVGIDEAPPFRVVRKILGPQGANMKAIAEKCDGVRMRLRGKGSKFLEGPEQKESDDPLMLCLTASSSKAYKAAVTKVKDLLEQVYQEYGEFCEKQGQYPPQLQVQMHEGARAGSR
jgi:hypothetical protein